MIKPDWEQQGDLQEKPSKEFLQTWLDKTKEVIDNYHPDLLWFDYGIRWIQEHYKREMLAYFYNQALERPGSGLDLQMGSSVPARLIDLGWPVSMP
jgi:alpha-L-fucosidase